MGGNSNYLRKQIHLRLRELNLSTNSGGGEQIKGHISSHPQSQNDIYFPRDGMLSTDTSSIKSQCNTY